MIAPHNDDERIFEKRSGGETLPGILKGPDREIKLAAIQQSRHVAQAGRTKIQPYSWCGVVNLTCGEQKPAEAGCAITRPRPHPAIGSSPRRGRSAASSARRDGVGG